MNPFGDLVTFGPLNLSVIEILWIVAAIDLFRVSRTNHGEALVDREALGEIQNGRRKMVDMNLYVARIFMGVALLKVTIGVMAALSPSNPSPSPVGVMVSVFLVIGLVAADFAMRSIRSFRLYINQHGLQNRDSQGRFVKATDTEGADLTE